MSQVPVQWGVHEDVFCAVRTHCSMLLMSPVWSDTNG